MAFRNDAIRAFFLLMVVSAAYAKAAEKEAAGSAAAASGPGATLDIVKLGATGDGKTDSTKVINS